MAAAGAGEGGSRAVPPGFRFLKEGTASILYEYTEGEGDKGEPVFYNKVQVLNRDLSIRMLTLFARHRAVEANLFKIRNFNKRAKAAADLLAGRPAAEQKPGQDADAEGRAGPGSPAAMLAQLPPEELDAKLRANDVPHFEGIRILDALAATGLRSIRYYKEIPGVSQVVVNDLEQDAVDAAKRNVEFNGCTLDQVSPKRGDANMAMLMGAFEGRRYDVIDLDPYGSAAPFIDAAVQAVADGGMLCVTCTDMVVLSGNDAQTCYAKYRSMPTHAKYLHENALRILLHTLETSACRYRRHIVPIISCSIDFYVRVFVRVFESPAEVKTSCLREAYVFQSMGCPSFFIQPVARKNGNSVSAAPAPVCGGTCPQTGARLKLGGPMWGDPIHDMSWVQAALRDVTASAGAEAYPPIQTKTRLHGLLTAVSEELPDAPLYYTMPSLCETIHCASPKWDDYRSALVNAGYRVSGCHKVPDAIKTDAPDEVVWDILRCWVKRHPINSKRNSPKSHGHTILSKEPVLQADFSRPKSFKPKPKAARFPPNPEEQWGPKSRARPKKRPVEDGTPGSQSKKPAIDAESEIAASSTNASAAQEGTTADDAQA